MRNQRNCATLLLAIVCGILMSVHSNGQETGAPSNIENRSTKDVHKLRPQFSTTELVKKSAQAIQDGLNFLVKTQNDDGSWGSHDPKIAMLANFGFQLRNRGNQDSVRTACTAICAEAFLNQPNLTAEQKTTLDKAIGELIKLPEIDPKTGKRRAQFAMHPGESFNTWGYGYKLSFLAALKASPDGAKFEKQIMEAGQNCIDSLLRYQQHNGGWHYYSNQMNGAGSMSFNTSFIALSLRRGKQMGLALPKGMEIDAAKVVDKQRVPDGSFHYDSRFFHSGTSALASLGSGSRTISNTLALYKMGFYSKQDLVAGMKVFDNGENYLEMGRKRIVPHSVVHQISGYFFFFGFNYASEAAEILGDSIPQKRWDRFGWTMLRTQEKNGCWWDTAAADYGDKWGTGFAIQTLQRYIRVTNGRQNKATVQNTSTSRKAPADKD